MSSTGKSVGKQARGTRARSIARKVAMQALYQWLLNQQSAAEIKKQFLESEESAGVDREHFEELVGGCIARNEELTCSSCSIASIFRTAS
jgi:N utilization substance protein B